MNQANSIFNNIIGNRSLTNQVLKLDDLLGIQDMPEFRRFIRCCRFYNLEFILITWIIKLYIE